MLQKGDREFSKTCRRYLCIAICGMHFASVSCWEAPTAEVTVGGKPHEALMDMLKTVHKAKICPDDMPLQAVHGRRTPLLVFLETLRAVVLVAPFVELPRRAVLQASQSMKQTVGADCPVFQAAPNIIALVGRGCANYTAQLCGSSAPSPCPLLLCTGRSVCDPGRRLAPSRTASHRVALLWPWSSFDES